MSRFQIAALCFLLVLSSVMANRFGAFPGISDHHDISIYFERGSWVFGEQQPYRDVFSEYPQIATWLFALPHLATTFWARVSGTELDGVQPYRYVFSAMMAIFLTATMAVGHTLRSDRKWLAFLLLLPASWYFVHNRFDIIPAFLTLTSLAVLRANRVHGAFVLLAFATATKWYAGVMLPVFACYIYNTNPRFLFSSCASYALVLVLIALPTLLAIGWQGFLIPYEFHMTRTGNSESLFHITGVTLANLGLAQDTIAPLLRKVFLVLQFAIAPLCVLVRIDTWEKVVRWSAISIICFMLFAKFYSPQWFLWIVPLLLLLVKTRLHIIGIVAFDLLTYIYFPYVYYLQDKPDFWFPGLIIVKTMLLAAWLLHFLQKEQMLPRLLTLRRVAGGTR